jgi:hypothetical protein
MSQENTSKTVLKFCMSKGFYDGPGYVETHLRMLTDKDFKTLYNFMKKEFSEEKLAKVLEKIGKVYKKAGAEMMKNICQKNVMERVRLLNKLNDERSQPKQVGSVSGTAGDSRDGPAIHTCDYHGETRNGVPHGKGKMKYSDGAVYEGQYVDGLKEGYGIMRNPSGSRFEGVFRDDEYSSGKYYYPNGGRYEGRFWNGKHNGHGKSYYANGDRYEGQYTDGKRTGGWYYFKDGRKEWHTD